MPPPSKSATATRDLRHRVLTSISKLSDKDTHSLAFSDLNSIIPTLTPATFSLFITPLSTLTTSRSAAHSSSLHLLSTLSTTHHGPTLSPHLPKLISIILLHLRHPDSSVRSSAISTTSSFATHITHPSFASSFLRPFSDAIATEQLPFAQSAAALCLSAALEGSPSPDSDQIAKLLPKWLRLLKSEGFKAKSSLCVLVRSAFRVCAIGNCNLLRDLVNCVAELLKNDEWATRKAAAELLKEIAVVERDSLSEFKAACLKTFESRKFDKVKAVREAMIQMLEVWKEIPDVFDDGSPPPNSQDSSKENASDGRYHTRSEVSTPQTRRSHVSIRRSSPTDSALKTTARNRTVPDLVRKKSSPPIARKLDSRKPSSRNTADYDDLHDSPVTPVYEDFPMGDGESVHRRTDGRPSKPEMKRGLFSKNSGSRLMPYPKEHTGSQVVGSSPSRDTCMHHKCCEDLSLIREQLVQIENQQSSLMDLLQKFVGSSHDGMRSLETRVHGLEQALDDISYDLAVSTARMPVAKPARTLCCSLPGSDFLSSKFWRRPDRRFSFSGGTPSVPAIHNIAEKRPPTCADTSRLENRRFHLRAAGGVIVNPLAEIHDDPRHVSMSSSSRMLRNAH